MEIEHLLRTHLARCIPGYTVTTVTPLGEGYDNVAYEINSELVVRISKEPDGRLRREAVDREVAVLATVRDWSALAVPQVRFADPGAGLIAYPKLEGVPLNECHSLNRQRVGRVLAEFHSGIARAPLSDVAELDDTPMTARMHESVGDFALIESLVPQRLHARIHDFLTQSPPERGVEVVFCHNDLGAEHILATPEGEPIAVIDWTDAAMADPAYDPGLVLRDLGPEVFDAMNMPELASRAWFYARCTVLGDIAYGIRENQPRYVANGLACLDHLFG